MARMENLRAAIDEVARVNQAAEALLDEALASLEASKELRDNFDVRWARKLLRSTAETQKVVRDYRLAIAKRGTSK